MIAIETNCRSTLRTYNRILLQIRRNRNAHVISSGALRLSKKNAGAARVGCNFFRQDKLDKIDQNRVSLSSAILGCLLPITLSTENLGRSFPTTPHTFSAVENYISNVVREQCKDRPYRVAFADSSCSNPLPSPPV